MLVPRFRTFLVTALMYHCHFSYHDEPISIFIPEYLQILQVVNDEKAVLAENITQSVTQTLSRELTGALTALIAEKFAAYFQQMKSADDRPIRANYASESSGKTYGNQSIFWENVSKRGCFIDRVFH